MAAIANVVVKATNGTTDVTYTALQGATGAEPAIWQNIASNAGYSLRSLVKMKSRDNGTKTARRIEIDGVYPVVRVENGVEVLKGSIPLSFTVPLPNWATDAEVNEAVDQFLNFASAAHVRSHIKGRFAPN